MFFCRCVTVIAIVIDSRPSSLVVCRHHLVQLFRFIQVCIQFTFIFCFKNSIFYLFSVVDETQGKKRRKKKINVCEYFFFGRLVERQNNKNNIVQCSFHKSFSMGFLRKTLCAQVSMVWMSLHRPQLLHSFGIHWMCIHFFFGRIQTKVWYNENLIRTFLCGTRINSFYFTWKNKIAFKKKKSESNVFKEGKIYRKKSKILLSISCILNKNHGNFF